MNLWLWCPSTIGEKLVLRFGEYRVDFADESCKALAIVRSLDFLVLSLSAGGTAVQ